MKILLILSTLLILTNCAGENVNELYQSIPKKLQDWIAEDKDEIYNRETLFDYINGGAELYLTYTFKEALVRRFVNARQTDMEIVLDIFDMDSSEEAFGIFSSEREDEEIGIGQDSEYGGGLLRFWKDRYFVSMVVLGDEQAAKPVMFELAHTVADAITSTGNNIPQEGLVEREIRYFHAVNCLNNYYYIASENILNLGKETKCVFAPYRIDQETGYLLLVQYVNEQQAEAAYESFLEIYMPEARETGFAQMENKKWTMAKINGQYIMIVFEAPDKDRASKLLSGVILKEE